MCEIVWNCCMHGKGMVLYGNLTKVLIPGGGGGTLYDGLHRAAPPKSGIFFWLKVYERVGIWLVEVYKKN